ncbi:MAG: hypothetical protein RJA81_1662 [Planctomycetota bacterium]|jgi:heavy metal sensor kinase
MSISSRINAFFLSALAFVLLIFSVVVYFLIESRLNHQLEDRATATIEAIISGCEWNTDGLSFKPAHHDITFQNESEPTIWAIFDEHGSRLDNSTDLTFPVNMFAQTDSAGIIVRNSHNLMGQPWLIFQKKLVHSTPETRPQPIGRNRYRALTIMTAWPIRPINETLTHLSEFLLIVSTCVWVSAALLGRWFCRKALSPLSSVANSVRCIQPNDLSRRLEVPHTHDELQSLAQAFNELMGRLEESFARQSRFAGEASHQLRTPLAGMLGQIDVTLRRERDPLQYQQTLERNRSQVLRLQKIVESLLFLARQDSESRKIETEPLDLNQWLHQHIDDVWKMNRRFTDLQFEIESGKPIILNTHAGMLAQALDNYIDNALKYSPNGKPIIIRVELKDHLLEISVEDSGPGIPESEIHDVFRPFFRSSQARSSGTEGTGLGLSIVARIIENLGGRVAVSSQIGQGSRFSLIFPESLFWVNHSENRASSDSAIEANTDCLTGIAEIGKTAGSSH